MESMMADVLKLVQKFALIGGACWTLWGVIVLASALKDKNGPGLQSGIWQIVGGGLIIAASVLFANITAS